MLRLIFAVIGLTLLPLQPIIGWFIFKSIQASEPIQIMGGFVWSLIAIFQLIVYGAIIVDFWKKRGVDTMFN